MTFIRSSLFIWCKFNYPYKLSYYLSYSHLFREKRKIMSHISRVFHFAIFPKIKREDREFAGKLVSRGFWEREPNTVHWKPWSSSANGNATFCCQDLAIKRLFYGCYHLKCFFPRSALFLDKLIHRHNCKSLECWPRFLLCTTVPQRCLTIWALQCLQVTTA